MTVFDPNLHIQTVTVVGLGGTGAQVARLVARIVYDMRVVRLHTPKIILIDPDTVEWEIVGRQLYTASHVGCPLTGHHAFGPVHDTLTSNRASKAAHW